MKTINQMIEESKIKNLFIPEYDVQNYVNKLLTYWLDNVRNSCNLTFMDNYTKILLCRQCEVLLYILDKFVDDVPMYFKNADKEEKNKEGVYGNWEANNVTTAFNIIMKVLEVEVENPKAGLNDGDDLEAEIKELKDRFEALVKKYNTKWHEKVNSEKDKENCCCVPVTGPCAGCCDCCCKEC